MNRKPRKRNYDSKRYNQWRTAVYKKDNYTCQSCNIKNTVLQAHHLKNFHQHPELRFIVGNGVTVCRKCHIRFHSIFGTVGNTPEQFIQFQAIVKLAKIKK